jgi:hypothetical protein
MVETACENNDECIDSDSDTIEIIVEKGMVVAVLADFFIVGVAQNCKRIVLRQSTKQVIFIQTDSPENCRVLFCGDLFHLC